MSRQAALQKAVALHRQGQLEQAAGAYAAVLERDPDDFDALCLLGALESQRRNFAAGATLFGRAAGLRPTSAAAHSSLGSALLALGRFEGAAASFDRALALERGNAEAWNNRGNALLALGRCQEALACYDRALALRPGTAELIYNRSNVLRDLGSHEDAVAGYTRALAIKPGYREALNKRGAVLRQLRQHEAALADHDRALAIKPDCAEALCNRGNVLLDLNRREEAVDSYTRALAASPGFAEAHYNLGLALLSLARPAEAARQFSQLLGVQPDFPYAAGELLYSQLHCCQWNDLARMARHIEQQVLAGKRFATPFAFLSMSESPDSQRQCASTYVRDKCPAPAPPLWAGERHGHERIRVAYLSSDFHDHATAYLAAELFELHDRVRFETHAISLGPDLKDAMRARLTAAFSSFVDVRGRGDRDVAQLLRAMEIDIAVDLKGHTRGSRPGILAQRPAPIQVNYLGYPGTMGAGFIDYIVADRITIPEEQRRLYSEKVVYLPDSYQPNDTRRQIDADTPSRAAAGLPDRGFVFCSFVSNYKIVPRTFDSWMRILAQVEGSVLWLLEGSADAVRNLRREAQSRGVAAERLIFAPRMPLPRHLARHRLADVFLDTLPINAHTTASDALWAGLPVLTCLGGSFAGKVAASLLNAVGLPELITHGAASYEALALDLARDPERLAALRAKLGANRLSHPLFDPDRLRRHLESAYETMVQRCRRAEAPSDFSVTPIAASSHPEPAPPAVRAPHGISAAARIEAGDHNNRANEWARLGRLEDAISAYGRALLLCPDFAEAHHNLGHALLDLGRFEEAAASCRRAIELEPRHAEAHDNLGSAQLALGCFDEAVSSYRRATAIEPAFAEAHNNLGTALQELGRVDEALASYDKALQVNPRLAEAHNNRGSGLRSVGKLDAAAASYGSALEIHPRFVEAHCNLAIVLRLQGRTAEAQASCRRALQIDPRSVAALLALAEASADRGDFAQAEENFQRALSIQPESPQAWAGLLRLRKMTAADAPWLRQAQRIAARGLAPRHEIPLRHAIGKYFDDVRDFEQAFANFRRANELSKLRRSGHDRQQLTRTVDLIIGDRRWRNPPLAGANPSARPVFIVGMLRSGTTLAEQILASHPAVFGAGELTFWSEAWALHGVHHGADARGAPVNESALCKLADDYLSLPGMAGDAARVIDKMPTNFPFLGLIHAALPNARVIHMRRNPLDTCLSIYMQPLEATVTYANDLEDLAHYYGEYLRIMDHWRSTLPADLILDVPYEELVDDQEAWSRRMLDFIGLPWDPRCMDFHRTERTVITASRWQVRQALNRSSVGRWRNYQKFLGPLLHLAATDTPQ